MYLCIQFNFKQCISLKLETLIGCCIVVLISLISCILIQIHNDHTCFHILYLLLQIHTHFHLCMVTILCRYCFVECASSDALSFLSLYGIGHILLDNCLLIVHTYFHKCMVIIFVLLIIYFRFHNFVLVLFVECAFSCALSSLLPYGIGHI